VHFTYTNLCIMKGHCFLENAMNYVTSIKGMYCGSDYCYLLGLQVCGTAIAQWPKWFATGFISDRTIVFFLRQRSASLIPKGWQRIFLWEVIRPEYEAAHWHPSVLRRRTETLWLDFLHIPLQQLQFIPEYLTLSSSNRPAILVTQMITVNAS
jgi:hypothetical protein